MTNSASRYIHSDIESKWQEVWRGEKLFSPDLNKAENPYYLLMMFPYPSAQGLHIGNMYAFTGADIYGRFKRLQGFSVLEPIGLDGFGIHSENYAIKVNVHPMELSKVTEEQYYRQLTMIGNAYDWTRTVETYKPNYYKWTQWLFLQMYKKGLAYRKKAEVNWCPSCLTVLADEQVISGECERCSTTVIKKELEQWFFKITDYAERLLENLDWIDWSETVKISQRNWIGKKEGINIEYQIEESSEKIACFTTRPDTNFGATFIVVGPEYPNLDKITRPEYLEKVKEYASSSKMKSTTERIVEGKKKTGEFTGSYAINNLNGTRLPIWVSDFVLGNVGTGAVVGVPGHDLRDFQFAKVFKLPVVRVVVGEDKDTSEITREEQVQEEEGAMVNSDFLNGLDIHMATQKVMDYLDAKGWGKRVTQYHLRDWLISRQRYWGPPIPIIYCDKCGTMPVPEEDLPVELPYIKDFRPTGTGKGPLASDDQFVQAVCPKCKGSARRETDVSDTFLDSSWYFLRYTSTEFEDKPFESGLIKKWLPVDMYIGGAEHSVLHLLYSRFTTMVLHDLGLLEFEEPFTKFRAHGLVVKDGAKMSKSKGNIVNPDQYIKEYGADTLRMYLMFMGPFSEGGDFRDTAVNGIYRFLTRVWGLALGSKQGQASAEESRLMNVTIKQVMADLETLSFNTSIAKLMELTNFLYKQESVDKNTLDNLLILLAPFAPHITEELWHLLGNSGSIHQQKWPTFDSTKLESLLISIGIQINGKIRDEITIEQSMVNQESELKELILKREKVIKHIGVNSVKKFIYIPGKIVNIVVG